MTGSSDGTKQQVKRENNKIIRSKREEDNSIKCFNIHF